VIALSQDANPKRVSFSVDEKTALRKQHALNPQLSQQSLCKWFAASFGKPIRQATVSEVLSSRYSHLGLLQVTPAQASVKKQRPQAYPGLERALSQWLFAYRNTCGPSDVVSAEVVKAKARFFWRQLPQYQGRQEPSFSDGWLANFKRRYGIKSWKLFARGQATGVDEAGVAVDLVSEVDGISRKAVS
jgi:hypothetical protein